MSLVQVSAVADHYDQNKYIKIIEQATSFTTIKKRSVTADAVSEARKYSWGAP